MGFMFSQMGETERYVDRHNLSTNVSDKSYKIET